MERGFLINSNWNWKEDSETRSDARIISNTKSDRDPMVTATATITLEITRTKKAPVRTGFLRDNIEASESSGGNS